MAHLGALRRRAFEESVSRQLNRKYPEKCQALTSAGLQDLIQDGIQRAGKMGVTQEDTVAKYIELMVVHDRNWEDGRNVRRLMRHPTLSGVAKVDVIHRQLIGGKTGA